MEQVRNKIRDIYSCYISPFVVENKQLHSYGLKGITLRPYQLEGVSWLLERFHHNHGCILGDEMGLGKTCQTISFFVALVGLKESSGPHLVLSPLSVLNNWKSEFARFAPDLKVVTYVGDKDSRPGLRKQINRDWDSLNVVVTTYELCLKDSNFFQRYQWHTLVVDEAHRLKNRESLLHQTLLEFDMSYRLLLTGTPIQNNMDELYSLLCFVAPNIFKDRAREAFVSAYSNISSDTEKTELHELLKPFLLRRIKTEVVRDLPKKTEVVLYHGMSALQKKYYKAILTKDLEIFENANQTTKTRLMNILMQLRKCVNHPYLFDGVEPEPFELGEHLVEASGKLVLIDQLLRHCFAAGHKVLMFSQMTHMLDILQDYLGYRGYNYERLDGSVRGEERYLAVQNFNTDDDTFVFLLSTRAGGQGLNLVAADTVIFVDSDFNPQNDLQAAARAHRIGQTRPVKVIRLIGRSTVEEIVLRRAEAKLELTNTVIEGGQFSTERESLIADNNMQLQDILKFGVDHLLKSDESTIEDIDLEAILGESCDGLWTESVDKQSLSSASMALETEDTEEMPQSLYIFEGTDYSKEPSAEDVKAFEQMIAAEKVVQEELMAGGRTSRASRAKKTTLMANLLPEPSRKPRKQLSQAELEERKRKRLETAARKAKEAEEQEIRRAQEAKRKLQALWDKNGYESCNVQLDSEGEEEEQEEKDDGGMEEEERKEIHYISGDVTHPQHTNDRDCIIVHCVDDSGSWGRGGVFAAISSRSQIPEEQYEVAGKMKDLALGDAHLITVDDRQKRAQGNDYVALVVAQHRDKRNNLSGIKLSALSQGLQRIYRAAKKYSASVHLPRIGHNTPGFNWYGTERFIRKHLASKGIATYIYYYPRKQAVKRKVSSDSSDEETSSLQGPSTTKPQAHSSIKKVRFISSDQQEADKKPYSCSLPDFMEGVNVYFYGLSEADTKLYSRYLIAYNGDVQKMPDDTTSHIIANLTTKAEMQNLQSELDRCDGLTADIVSTKWLKVCFWKRKVVHWEKYCINLQELA